MREILECLLEARDLGESVVIATIVNVEGSAYRREGTKMVFRSSGLTSGTLSAGCLEEDLMCRAAELLQANRAAILTYDLSVEDDLSWGRGPGCNGVLTVLVEPVHWFDKGCSGSYWRTVLDEMNAGTPISTIRKIDMSSNRILDHAIFGQNHFAVRSFQQSEPFAKTKLQLFSDVWRSASVQVGSQLYFLDYLEPKEQVTIFGAGPDVEPVVALLTKVHFDVTVVDHRPARLSPARFPDAKRRICARPENANSISLPDASYALIMTHSFQDDVLWLGHLLRFDLRYLGVLGPQRRTQKLFDRLGIDNAAQRARVHSPMGVGIGAEGPEEIAVSVVAQLIAQRHANDRQRLMYTACSSTVL
ncbi:XdhC family protein [Alicyclobacillus acidoterrestris]|uniref:XdhC family protein n=1 Tax=Alicyclobacillus acidoterrestris (strain ATCC 49025 / DSM 3922 / CIP 106132 / NCIMB 13137 / GD3B) TaxID=1356854 RepID=T0CK67_ALIAG|nr:XdhC/CoxI family protein [Alicyclobacillus acidoterrestris]EPZ52905.1 hypothetical protein N007_02045 [Alicyclobacillus acidoterrestris ATCC 49025]UNO49117.1 XdhC family protein [Alicyclobacillus acidoterrestris]